VPLDLYGSGALESLLGNIDEVGRVAMAHEAVVEHFALRSGLTVIPLKLFTMFSTLERAVADIAGRGRSLERAMKKIEGAEEWGVRVTRRTTPAAARIVSAKASGKAFLAAKKQARDQVEGARVAAAEAATAVFDRLTAVSRDARRRDDRPVAGASPPLLDAAFLVDSRKRDRFTAAARQEAQACERAGAQLTMTGPWPAYNFIQGDDRR
jgi:hypothetical protein